VTLLESLLEAIVRLDGDALIMHVGEKPYVVLGSSSISTFRGPLSWGQVELSSRPLSTEAVMTMLAQMLSPEQRRMLDDIGAIEHEIQGPGEAGERFVVTAARGGEDVWIEVKRKPNAVESPALAGSAVEPGATAPAVHTSAAGAAPPLEERPAPAAEHAVGAAEERALAAPLDVVNVVAQSPPLDPPAVDVEALIGARAAALEADAEAALAAKAAALAAAAEVTLAERVAALTSDAETTLAARQAALAAASEASLAEKSEALAAAAAAAEAALAAREAAFAAAADRSLAERASAVASEAESALAAREAALAEAARTSIAEHAAALAAEAEAVLAARQVELEAAAEATLAEKAATLAAEMQTVLAAREASLAAAAEAALADRIERLTGDASAALARREAELEAAAQELAARAATVGTQVETTLSAREAALAQEAEAAIAATTAALTAEADALLAEREMALEASVEAALASRLASLSAEAHAARSATEAALAAGAEATLAAHAASLAARAETVLAERLASLEEETRSARAGLAEEARAACAALEEKIRAAYAARQAALAEAEAALATQAAMLAERTESVLAQRIAALEAEARTAQAAREAALAADAQAALAAQAAAPAVVGQRLAAAPPQDGAVSRTDDAPEVAVVVPMPGRPTLKLQQPPPQPALPAASTEASLVELLRAAAAHRASTVYAVVDTRPMMRVDGQINVVGTESFIAAGDVERFIFEFAPRNLVADAAPEWTCTVPGVGRVRCVTFHDQSGAGLIFHLPATDVSTADEVGLSGEIQALCRAADGLIVITGPRASGKSSMLNAIVDVINRTRYDHVITIESRIRVRHERRCSFISQREVRGDGDAVASAARSALREGADVLVIEDLRAPEALGAALDAARAGRLVLGSISAPSAPVALERLVDAFPPDRRPHVRASLAGALRAVVAQVLVAKVGGGRTAAREVLLSSPAVRKLLLEGATGQLPIAIEGGRSLGMRPMVDALGALVRDGSVDIADACAVAPDRAALIAALERDGVDVSAVERRA
jgi:twitching motility protein PilT